MNWANKRKQTIKDKPLIDFLASNTVIPKYGFQMWLNFLFYLII